MAAFLPRMEPEGNGRVVSGTGAPGGGAGLRLERYLRATDSVLLHQLRLPGKRREIDELIVGPAGITVVDSRHYRSKRASVSPTGALRIGRRGRSDLVDEVLGQVAELRDVLAGTPYARVPVEAALVLSKVEGVPVIESFNQPRVLTWGARWVAREASRPGPLDRRNIDALASFLAGELA